MFAMRDNYHEFFISLLTVLSCLAFAEREGVVPELLLYGGRRYMGDIRNKRLISI